MPGTAFLHNRRNINIPLICDNALRVIIHFFFYGCNLCRYIWNLFHLRCNLIVLFQQLYGKETLLFLRYARTNFIFRQSQGML